MAPSGLRIKEAVFGRKELLTQERELLGILDALRTWRCFLEGRFYEVSTDDHTLKYLRSQSKPTPRLVRWMNELELYNPNYHVQARQGK